MVNKAKHYHSYTKDVRYLISEMHPSHIVNALAVIQEGRHKKYFVGDPVYTALVAQLLENTKQQARKRGLGRKPVKRKQYAQGYPSLAQLRNLARGLIRTRGFVAADSLRHAVDEAGYAGLPGLDFCPVFRVKDFLSIGRKPSSYPTAKGREIRVYILA
jgi:hypothetical protein